MKEKEDSDFIDVTKLSIDEIIELETITASHKLLDHITIKSVMKQLPTQSYEDPRLETLKIEGLYPTQMEIEKAKYDRLKRLYVWELESCEHIKKGQKINLVDVPIVVLTSPEEVLHRKLILSGHARARYKLDEDPESMIRALVINCYDNNYVNSWSMVEQNLKAIGINSLKDLKFY